jgi:hypothetical protein
LKGSLNSSHALATIFTNYPSAPVANSAGWKFGTGTTDYLIQQRTASEFGQALFGTNKYAQTPVSSSIVTVDRFTGTLSYAYFYDRPLYDYEVDSIFAYLQIELSGRGIELYGTANRVLKGTVRIQKPALQKLDGVAQVVKGRTPKLQLGIARMQQIGTFVQTGISKVRANINQLGVTRVGQGSVQYVQRGLSRLRINNMPTQHGKSRIYTTVIREAFGIAKIRLTFSRTQFGGAWMQITSSQIKTGVTKITATTKYDSTGVSRIYKTTQPTQLGVARIQKTTVQQTRLGVASIRNTTKLTHTGTATVQNITAIPQTGRTYIIFARTLKTQIGVSSMVKGRTQVMQSGVTHINVI